LNFRKQNRDDKPRHAKPLEKHFSYHS